MPPLQTTADQKSHSELTREGIARSQARGVAWGTHSALLAQKSKDRAKAFAEKVRPVLLEICTEGGMLGPGDRINAKRIADELNARGHPAQQGGNWQPTTVRRLIERLGTSFRDEVKQAVATKSKAKLKAVHPEGDKLWTEFNQIS